MNEKTSSTSSIETAAPRTYEHGDELFEIEFRVNAEGDEMGLDVSGKGDMSHPVYRGLVVRAMLRIIDDFATMGMDEARDAIEAQAALARAMAKAAP